MKPEQIELLSLAVKYARLAVETARDAYSKETEPNKMHLVSAFAFVSEEVHRHTGNMMLEPVKAN